LKKERLEIKKYNQMKTRSNLQRNDKKNGKKSLFWSFMGGEFLLKESVIRWYPFVLILFVFAIIMTQNEAFILKKYEKIKELDAEYKKIKTQMRFENTLISHDISPEIIKLVEEQGFLRKDSATFKITVKSK
jgi:hypothetical protein